MTRTRPRYRWRTRLRRHLPFWVLRLEIAQKGRRDCGLHEWYRETEDQMRCYHCAVGRMPGRLEDLPDDYWTELYGEEEGQDLIEQYRRR